MQGVAVAYRVLEECTEGHLAYVKEGLRSAVERAGYEPDAILDAADANFLRQRWVREKVFLGKRRVIFNFPEVAPVAFFRRMPDTMIGCYLYIPPQNKSQVDAEENDGRGHNLIIPCYNSGYKSMGTGGTFEREFRR